MAYEPIFNIEGNLISDPDLRFTPNGKAVASFRVGINDARPAQNDGKTGVAPLIAEVSVWREMAENAAETLVKGMRITAKVRMVEIGAYIPRGGGDPVGTLKVEALDIGPSLRWAKAHVSKATGNNSNGQQNQQQAQPNGGQQGSQQAQGGGNWGAQQGQNTGADPWGQPGGGAQHDPWATNVHPGNAPAAAPAHAQSQNPTPQGQGNGWGSNQDWGNTSGGWGQ